MRLLPGSAILFAVCVALLPMTVCAQDGPSAIRAFDIKTTEKLGLLMAEQADEAANADEVLAAQQRNAEQDGIVGWIFDPAPGQSRVRFLRQRDGKVEVAYDVGGGKGRPTKFSVPTRRELTPREIAQFNARQLAARNIEKPCSPVYNTLAVKDPGSDRWLVWALATAPEPGAVAIGGHIRFTISADGTTVISRDALSLGCIVITPEPPPPGKKSMAALVTHLVSDAPVETHVFVNLLYDLPLLVEVPGQSMWQIERGHIRRLDGAVKTHAAR